ncbi:MAG TPA: HlyD family efflux transporter periplasmic adaptor subunit [Candidatus Methylomirabilis sp.]|nr:HlyD family efflux transporter periplasmic adaptor subunit [Candidatus Methylomirabilis sp.]
MIQHVKRIVKKKSVIIAASLVAVTGTAYEFNANKPAEPVRYVLAAVTRGTLVMSVTGSGQVSGLNQIDVKPGVSGAVTKILVKPGEEVKAGAPLFEIERKTAQKSVRDATQSVQDAKLSVQSAELSLLKLKQPVDPVALVQARNSVNKAKRDLAALKEGPDALDVKQAEAELALQTENVKLSDDGTTPQVVRDAYDDAVSTVKATAQTLQQALYDADVILGIDNPNLNDAYEKLLAIRDSNKLFEATNAYYGAKQSVSTLKENADALKSTGEDAVNVQAALAAAETALGLMDPFLQKVHDALMATISSASFSQSSLDGLRNTIQSDRTSVSSKMSTLTSQIQAIDQAKSSYESARLNVDKSRLALEKLKRGTDAKDIASAQEHVAEAEAALAKLQKGADSIDVAMSENTLAQRRSSLAAAQNKLADANETLGDYTVRAPFDGVVAKVSVHESDQASPSTALATLLTKAKIAQISLNEVDVAKVRADQKATLTFDAVPDLTIAGAVIEVDSIGTVTQGVVSYNVRIAFVTQDERIKTGMSVSASVVTDVRTDALLAPNAAVKREGNTVVVQTLAGAGASAAASAEGIASDTPPETKTVQAGLSNEQVTEIVSGLNDGERVVTRTIDPNATAAAASSAGQSSALRIPGLSGGGTGASGFRAR